MFEKVQNGLKSDAKIITHQIISGIYRKEEASIPPTAEAYWRNIFESRSITDYRQLEAQHVYKELLQPITLIKINNVLSRKTKGSPGIDGYTWRNLKKVNMTLLVSCFNLWLISGRSPSSMSKGITTLLPKVIGTTNPAEFRPTTVTSTFSRLYHCILGERFANTLPYNDRQNGFKKGLYFNTKLGAREVTSRVNRYTC